MTLAPDLHLMHEVAAPGIRVIRFLRPDLRPQLDPIVGDDNPLFREIVNELADLAAGDRVVMNFGLVERFPTAFFQLLMKVRQHVIGRQATLALCGFRPEILPSVELMGGSRLFGLAATEEAALHAAGRRSSHG